MFGVLPVVIRSKSFRPPWRAGRQTLLLLTGAVILGGILGPLLLLLGLRVARSGAVSLRLNLEFVATVILGYFVFSTAPFFGELLFVGVLGETFTGMQALAAGIIAVSLVLLFTEKHEHVHAHKHWPDLHHRHGHTNNENDEPPNT